MTTPPLSDETLIELAKHLAPLLGQPAPERRGARGVDSWVTAVVGALAVISIIFSVGVNWSRLAELERIVTALSLKVESTDREVMAQATNGAVVSSRLDQIQRDVTEIKTQVFRKN